MNPVQKDPTPPRPTLVANDVDDDIESLLAMFDDDGVPIDDLSPLPSPPKSSPVPVLDHVDDLDRFQVVPDDVKLFEHMDALFSTSSSAGKAAPVIAKVTVTVTHDLKSIDARREALGIAPCTCKKSKCVKFYCECFRAGIECGTNCQCLNCCNTVPRDVVEVPAKEFTGCTCKKNKCLKKYCECFAAKRACTSNCQCQGCGNAEQHPPAFYEAPRPRPKARARGTKRKAAVQMIRQL